VNFKGTIDMAHWFKHENKSTRYSKYGYQFWTLEHELKWLLDIDIRHKIENPYDRALYSMMLFNKYKNSPEKELAIAQKICREHQRDVIPKLFVKYDEYEGVCTGHITTGYQGKTCHCGKQTLYNQTWTK
jgi:hypothetical protein